MLESSGRDFHRRQLTCRQVNIRRGPVFEKDDTQCFKILVCPQYTQVRTREMSLELTRVQAELTDPVPLGADKDHAVAGNLLAADTLQEGQASATLLMSGQGLAHPLKVDSDGFW